MSIQGFSPNKCLKGGNHSQIREDRGYKIPWKKVMTVAMCVFLVLTPFLIFPFYSISSSQDKFPLIERHDITPVESSNIVAERFSEPKIEIVDQDKAIEDEFTIFSDEVILEEVYTGGGVQSEKGKGCKPLKVDPGKVAIYTSATPQYVYQYYRPGCSYDRSGQFGYVVEEKEKMMTGKELKKLKKVFEESIFQSPDKIQQYKDVCGNIPEDSNGCLLLISKDDGSIAKVLSNGRSEKMKNYKKMVRHQKNWVGNIENLSEGEIVEKLIEDHRTLFKGSLDKDGGLSLGFRTTGVLVFQDVADEGDRSEEHLSQLILQRGGSREDVKIFKRMLKKFSDSQDFDYEPTKREREASRWICYIPPNFMDVPRLIQEFARNLKQSIIEMKRCGTSDPIDVASYAHTQIGRIHPFADGNGRMARGLLNAILMNFGVDPVIFTSDEEYTFAVNEDLTNPGYFAQYLRDVVIPSAESMSQFLETDFVSDR